MRFRLALCSSVVLLSCGSSEEPVVTEPDAGAPTEMLTVNLGVELAGATVFSSEEDGTLIASAIADQEGKAMLLARDGGMASFHSAGANLTTILSVDTQAELLFEVSAGVDRGGQSITVDIPSFGEVTDYTVYACQDRSHDRSAPFSVELNISDACLAAPSFTVVSFASDFSDVLAYATTEVDSELVSTAEIDLVWQTDFEEVSVEFAVPALTRLVRASPVLQYELGIAVVPSHDLSLVEPLMLRPPGEALLLWTDLTAFANDSGWQEHRGPLPTNASDWLLVPPGLVVNHTAAVGPELRWVPTGEGDLVYARYTWDTEVGFGFWGVLARPEDRGVIFPELPAALANVFPVGAPQFAFATVNIIDYKDIEGYAEAMDAGRLPWPFSGVDTDTFLGAGGAMAIGATSEFFEAE